MHFTPAILPAARSGFNHRSPSSVTTMTLVMALAVGLLGGCASNVDQKPRIALQPSPERQVIKPGWGGEVLDSSTFSGAYIAFHHEVPRTKFFRVLGRADCDDVVRVEFLRAANVRAAREYYTNGSWKGNQPHYGCPSEFHRKFRSGNDPRLAGADGVIFDTDTFTVPDYNAGLMLGDVRVQMSGWAIKFADPTPEDLKAMFSRRPGSTIARLQFKAALYWIMTHRLVEYAADIEKLLPDPHGKNFLVSWHEPDKEALEALATIAPDRAKSMWLSILAAGVDKGPYSNPANPIATQAGGDAPRIAGNILACSGDKSVIPELERVAREATILQHKQAAMMALATLGHRDAVAKMIPSVNNPSLQSVMRRIADGTYTITYKCPYEARSIGNKS